MKSFPLALLYISLLLPCVPTFSQQIKFNRVLEGAANGWTLITGIAQDQQGYIWFSTLSGGFYQYDGLNLKTYKNDSLNENSLANDKASSLTIDSLGIIWIGTMGSGLDKFDPSTKTFTHFKHDPKNISSLVNDSISTLFVDHSNNVWIGTRGGLEFLSRKTGRFVHFIHNNNDNSSLSNNHVFSIYEDKESTLWVGCGLPFFAADKPEDGGLNKLNRATGKFTKFMHNPADASGITNNHVTTIFEDSKGNLWIGTDGDGLHIMNRKTGKFIHYPYDPSHPKNLSRPPLLALPVANYITFIKEDATGAIWIGCMFEGINRYDPVTRKITHYGNIVQQDKILQSDTSSGFNELSGNTPFRAITSKDNLFWIGTYDGNMYNISLDDVTVPYYNIKTGANSFFEEGDSILWIATDGGLMKRNRKTGIDKKFISDPKNSRSISGGIADVIRVDEQGNFWLSTNGGGLSKFDPRTDMFTQYKHDPYNKASLGGDSIFCMHIDKKQNLWMGITYKGLDKLDIKRGMFTHYRHNSKDSSSLINDSPNCIAEDIKNNIWVGTQGGLDMLDQRTNRFYHYLKNLEILCVSIDAAGNVWVGAQNGFYKFDADKNEFQGYKIEGSPVEIKGVLHILEDDKGNLWLSTIYNIIKINPKRNTVALYGKKNGVHTNGFYLGDNYKAGDGELFIGDPNGYYAFFPDELKESQPPQINFSSFILNDQEQMPAAGSLLKEPIWKTKEIKLNYKQTTFSFDFKAIDYAFPAEMKYLFLLENYDDTWHDLGTDHKAYFFNVPPGNYFFHIKAIDSGGGVAEKVLAIIIYPPWWRTRWAYAIFGATFIAIIWGFIYYRSKALRRENRVLEEKVAYRTAQLNQSLDELKATQKQLIQKEKMASLGELTAGIAHEIQNPLNFVNNFSEVSRELIEELKSQKSKLKGEEQDEILNDIDANLEKINHHGKRADAIVKGMLQHSRTSSGQKELTDINALCEEYLRLSYHGLRAKDKNFNAEIKTDFDNSIGKINVSPQDIGRVILNLINNAFYAVGEKQKIEGMGYEPTVTVSTKKLYDKIEIIVKDNGNGIPKNAVDKIFQPFFTTKPTGQGTGLGLSLAYDIIKAHGGEIRVETIEGEGSEFIIQLPLK